MINSEFNKISHETLYNFDFKTSYRHFYILDNEDGDTPDLDDEFETRLAANGKALSILTESYGHIRGQLLVLDEENNKVDLAKYDHVVEAGISITNGKLYFLNCPDSDVVLKIKLNSGRYMVRIYTFDVEEDMEDDFESTDRYRIEIWPSTDLTLKVLKQIK